MHIPMRKITTFFLQVAGVGLIAAMVLGFLVADEASKAIRSRYWRGVLLAIFDANFRRVCMRK